MFIQELNFRYSDSKRASKNNPEYQRLRRQSIKIANSEKITDQDKKKTLVTLSDKLSKLRVTPSVIRNKDSGPRVYYYRYADDWNLGISGDQELAQ